MTALFKCRCIFRTRSLRWISSTSTRKELVSFLYPAYVVAKSNTLGIDGRLTTEYRLYSPGEIIQLLSASIIIVRMKHCPQKDDLIATTSDSGGIYLFDLSHHPTSPINSEPHPQYHLNAHTGPCPGLDWSMARERVSGLRRHGPCRLHLGRVLRGRRHPAAHARVRRAEGERHRWRDGGAEA